MTWWQLCIVMFVGAVSLRLVIEGIRRPRVDVEVASRPITAKGDIDEQRVEDRGIGGFA